MQPEVRITGDTLHYACVGSVAQTCPTLCDPMDCSPPGSSVHGIFQARMLEWVAISSSRESSQHRDRTLVSCIFCIGRQILYHCTTWEAPYCTILNANGFFFFLTLKSGFLLLFSFFLYFSCYKDLGMV